MSSPNTTSCDDANEVHPRASSEEIPIDRVAPSTSEGIIPPMPVRLSMNQMPAIGRSATAEVAITTNGA